MPLTTFMGSGSAAAEPNKQFDPDEFRMTVGEHLEDLRRRLVLALIGFVVAACFCLYYGRTVIFSVFCRPLTETLKKFGLPPQLHSDQVPDVFASYLNISLISAAAIASPWIVWQFWQFIAAGLYPHERKYVTRYVPLSITLLITGMLFVYYFVLPWTLEFFIAFTIGVPLPLDTGPPPAPPVAVAGAVAGATQPTTQPTFLQIVPNTPHRPAEGQWWYNQSMHRLEAMLGGEVRVIRFSADQLIATDYKLPDYINLVVGMLVTFGLSFQMPLVVLALVRVGIVERETLKSARQYVYFGIAVLSATITPGDTITATVLLTGPLILLYELGIWLSREPRRAAGEPA
ncbi:MAG TPA: twin-arginine translocase subunit TatC [Tepidisphaeraceae bacterium]|nr:twin-arginine translocase subunit TatC [Tepidisphaeraceae bacterium]